MESSQKNFSSKTPRTSHEDDQRALEAMLAKFNEPSEEMSHYPEKHVSEKTSEINNQQTLDAMHTRLKEPFKKKSRDPEVGNLEETLEKRGISRLRLFEDLHVSLRWANKLEDVGITSVGDLLGLSEKDLLSRRGIGPIAIMEIESALKDNDLPPLNTLASLGNIQDGIRHPQLLTNQEDQKKRFHPFAFDTHINYRKGPDRHIIFDEWPQRSLKDLPRIHQYFDCIFESTYSIQIGDIPGLFELLPYPQNIYYGRQEYISTILICSIEHMITDFGFDATAAITNKILANLIDPRTLNDELEQYAKDVAKAYPPELSYSPINWLLPDFQIDSKHYSVTRDLIGEQKTFVSVYIASRIRCAFQRLTSLEDPPYKIDELFANLFFELGSKSDIRAIDTYIKRNGLGVPKQTLEQIGQELGVTRERVRQIESKTSASLKLFRSERLLLLRMGMLGLAKELGNAGKIDNLQSAFVKHRLFDADTDSFGLLELLPEYNLDKNNNLYFLDGYPCTSCENALRTIHELLSSSAIITHEEFVSATGCASCPKESAPVVEAFDKVRGIRTTSSSIGSPNNPIITAKLKPSSERALLRAILYDACDALTYDEMIELIYEKTGNRPSKTKISSQVGSFSDCLLWGRGTYIHEKNVPFPEKLLSIISERIIELFDANQTPIIGVEGIYAAFEKQLKDEGIPTQHGLYSLLRKQADKRLLLREYPWICNPDSIGDRTSFAKYFYSILEDNNGFITDEHAKMIADKTMAQSFALGGLAEYSPFVINANGGWYDIGAAGFDMEGIASLAEEVAENMRDNDIVSAVKVFEEHRERCFRYGVKSHDMLYYLVDMMEDDLPIEATRKPHFVKSEHKGLSAVAVMRMYIEDAEQPVSKDELYEEFITNRRLNLRGICGSLLVNKEIIDVGNERYWSRKKLAIDDDFIESVETAIEEQISSSPSRRIANLFVARDTVIPSLSTLPQPSGIAWNTTLLRTALSKSAKFRLFGESSNCLVDLQKNPGVTDVEAFFKALLDNEFYGWSSFENFANYCRAHAIHSHIEPEFFDAFSSIKADEGSIQTV